MIVLYCITKGYLELGLKFQHVSHSFFFNNICLLFLVICNCSHSLCVYIFSWCIACDYYSKKKQEEKNRTYNEHEDHWVFVYSSSRSSIKLECLHLYIKRESVAKSTENNREFERKRNLFI